MWSLLIDVWTALGHASGVTRSANAYAFVSALHVFGIALLIGPIVLVDLRLLGRFPALDVPAIQLLRSTARVGVVLAVTTGLLLASTRPAEYLANRVFLAKMAVVAIAVANALWFDWRARRVGSQDLFSIPAVRIFAGLSLLAWPLALGLGRWIAFV